MQDEGFNGSSIGKQEWVEKQYMERKWNQQKGNKRAFEEILLKIEILIDC